MLESLNTRLKKMLEERGMSQRELARKAEVTESSVTHYLKGDRMPTSATLAKLAGALGTTPDYLLFGEPFTEGEKLDASVEMVKRCAAYLTRVQKLAIMDALIAKDDED